MSTSQDAVIRRRELGRLRMKRYRERHPDRIKESRRRYELAHPEKLREHSAKRIKEYYQRHPGIHYQQNKDWRANHPLARNAQQLRYHAKHRRHAHNSGYLWTLDEIEAILDPDGPGDVGLSRSLGRSVKAIQVKRCVLGGKTNRRSDV